MKYLIIILLVISISGCATIRKQSEYRRKLSARDTAIKDIIYETAKMDDCQGSLCKHH